MAEPPVLGQLIRRQESVVSRSQALHAGLSRHAIDYRLRKDGPWRVLLPGVYLTMPTVATPTQRETAAILHGGPQAVITGAAALRFYSFRQVPGREDDPVDILVPVRVQRRNFGCVRVHRSAHMPPGVGGPAGRRFVTPARAVSDLARWLTDLREVRALVAGAVQEGRCAVRQLAGELAAGGAPHGALLRRVLAEVADGVRSAPEAELRELLSGAGLPAPLFNPRLYWSSGQFIACPDAWWPEAGVAIEVDSRQWHASPADWERTMSRHADLGQYGIVTLHVTPHQLRADPGPFLRQAANAYRAGRARPRLDITTRPATG